MNINKHAKELDQLAKALQAAGDLVRIRIICLLFEHKTLCVGDIAQMMNMSMSAISHHLQILKEADLLTGSRDGQMICYSITKQPFTDQLKKLLC